MTALNDTALQALVDKHRPDLDDMIAAVKREIGMRQRVYPGWVASGKMTQAKADKETASMAAVLALLIERQTAGRLL